MSLLPDLLETYAILVPSGDISGSQSEGSLVNTVVVESANRNIAILDWCGREWPNQMLWQNRREDFPNLYATTNILWSSP